MLMEIFGTAKNQKIHECKSMATIKIEKGKETRKSHAEYTQQELNNVSVLMQKGTNLESEGLILTDARAMDNPRILNVARKILSEYREQNRHDAWRVAFAGEVIAKISDELERISQQV